MADKKEDRKIAVADGEKHDGVMSDPTVAATLKSWTTMTFVASVASSVSSKSSAMLSLSLSS